MTKLTARQSSLFVQPGRCMRIYNDPTIFELELEWIFGTAWISVAHESQVKHPKDYFATRIGRKPVVLVRDWDQSIHVHNQCAHRGALLVVTKRGNAAEFTCCYHGWTYHQCKGKGVHRRPDHR